MCNDTETAVCSSTHNMDPIHPWILYSSDHEKIIMALYLVWAKLSLIVEEYIL